MSQVHHETRRQSVKELKKFYSSRARNNSHEDIKPKGRSSLASTSRVSSASTDGNSKLEVGDGTRTGQKRINGETLTLTTQALLDELNPRRERCGLKPFRWREELAQSANTIAHENVDCSPEVSDFGELVNNNGYQYQRIAERTLWTSSQDPKHVVESLLNGSNEIVSDEFMDVGIAILPHKDEGESLRLHILGHFARPQPTISPPSEDLQAEIDQFDHTFAAIDVEIDEMKGHLDEREGYLNEMRNNLDKMQKDIDEMKQDLEKVDKDLDGNPTDVEKYNELVNQINEEVNQRNELRDEFNEKVKQYNELQEKHEEKVNRLNELNAVYNEKVREHQRQVREYNHQISVGKVYSKIDELREYLRVIPPSDINEYNRLINELNENIEQHRQLQKQYDEERKEEIRQRREQERQMREQQRQMRNHNGQIS